MPRKTLTEDDYCDGLHDVLGKVRLCTINSSFTGNKEELTGTFICQNIDRRKMEIERLVFKRRSVAMSRDWGMKKKHDVYVTMEFNNVKIDFPYRYSDNFNQEGYGEVIGYLCDFTAERCSISQA